MMRKIFNLSLTSVAVLVLALSLSVGIHSNRLGAQQALSASETWQNWTVQEALSEVKGRSNCVVSPSIASSDDTIRYGTTYQFSNNHSGFFGWGASFVTKPSETVAMQELYAVDVNAITPDFWKSAVDAANNSAQEVRFSVLLKNKDGTIGAPVQWTSTTASLVSDLLAAGQETNDDNAALRAYSAALLQKSVAKTMESHGMVPSPINVNELSHVDCGAPGQDNSSLYLGLSIEPQASAGVEIKPVTSVSGLYDERLGVEYSSWPYRAALN